MIGNLSGKANYCHWLVLCDVVMFLLAFILIRGIKPRLDSHDDTVK